MSLALFEGLFDACQILLLHQYSYFGIPTLELADQPRQIIGRYVPKTANDQFSFYLGIIQIQPRQQVMRQGKNLAGFFKQPLPSGGQTDSLTAMALK